MRYSQCLLGVLALTTRLVNAISPPDTLVEKKSHYLFDSAPPGAQWVNTLGEIVLPKKYEWGHYAVKELNLESTRCEGNKTSSHEGLERRAPTCPPDYVLSCPTTFPRPCCPKNTPNCCRSESTACCGPDTYCQGLHSCCPTVSKGCGEGCCFEGTTCCLESICCGPTYMCSSEGCVPNPCPGKTHCGELCCDVGSGCCRHGTLCCAPGMKCCGEDCCPSSGTCVQERCVLSDPCSGKVKCGTGCCNAGNLCCDDTLCCAGGTTCCGSNCCTAGYTCQDGQCVANDPCPGKVKCSDTSCCDTGTTCCGDKCCGEGSSCQDGNCVVDDPCPGKVRCSSGCCPAGTECSGNECCTRGKNCPGDCPESGQEVCPGKTFCCPTGYICPDSLPGVCTDPRATSSSVSVPATILTVPPPNPSTTGPTMVDVPPTDPGFQYQPAGAWSNSTSGSPLGICTNNTKVSSQAGATISYTFSGIAVEVKVVRGQKAMTYRIDVDGQNAGTLDSFSSNTVCAPENGGGKEGLGGGGPHTITITLDGPSSSTNAAGPLFEFSGLTVVTAGTIAGNGEEGTMPVTSIHVFVSCAVLLLATLLWGS